MKTRLISLSILAVTSVGMAQLFGPVETVKPPAEVVAETIVEGCDAALKDRCERMKNLWSTLWENERATPAQILTALGTNARTVFLAAKAARDDLEAVAALAGKTPAGLLGDAKYLSPKLPVTFHSDGRVTLVSP